MASVGILTFLHNANYGSSLQAYALQRAVREAGFDCEHLDYRPDREEKIRNLLRSGNSPKRILEGMRKRGVQAGQEGAQRKSRAIPDFYAKHMKLSPPCRNGEELRKQGKKHEILLCGSDQIWNPMWLNEAYFLTFAEAEQRKLAYAASLGVNAVPREKKARMIRRWTADFEAVSVREEEGADLLEKITGKRPEVMPDPVCLLSPEEWDEIAEAPPAGESYLLCYFIGENGEYWEKVKETARETGLRVLAIPVTAESYRSEYELLDGIGPEAFLGAVKGAARLVTDSFHGLVFGTLFGVPTDTIRREREGDPESRHSRVENFLRLSQSQGMEKMREQGRTWINEHIGKA